MKNVCKLLIVAAVIAGGRLELECASPGADGETAFAQMKKLEGAWVSGSGDKDIRTVFELTANGTVLLERYSNPSLPGGGQMVTAYHLDGNDLVLTHYCIANNQPVLRAERVDSASGRIEFELVRVSNLRASGAGHMRRARYLIHDANTFTTEWDFFADGVLKKTETEKFTRVK